MWDETYKVSEAKTFKCIFEERKIIEITSEVSNFEKSISENPQEIEGNIIIKVRQKIKRLQNI